MLLSELFAIPGLRGRALRPMPAAEIDRVCDNSRVVKRGDLFVAVEGMVSDGHDYLFSAYESGCRAFVVQEEKILLPEDAFVYLAEDSREALALLSAKILGNPADRLTLIGITGTKGKTTVALMLTEILCRAGIRAGYIGSNGVRYADVSLPDTKNTTPGSLELQTYLADMAAHGVTHAVLEVSSQALYLKRVFGLTFPVTVFTNLAPDHIGGAEHPTFEHYKACKRSLFFDYGTKTVVYNADDPHAPDMLPPGVPAVSVSMAGRGDYTASAVRFEKRDGYLGTGADCSLAGKNRSLSLRLPGRFNVCNALTAIAAAKALGVDEDVSLAALASVTVKGRFECVPLADDRYFVIDFAHNGLALRSVLAALKEYGPRRLVCLFGSVGGRTRGRRRDLGDAAAEACDLAILTADNPDFEPPEEIIADILPSFEGSACAVLSVPDRREAIRLAVERSRPGDVVLLAGKGHEDYQLVRGKRLPFSEREILLSCQDLLSAAPVN